MTDSFWQTLLAGAVGGVLGIGAAVLGAVVAWRLQRSSAQKEASRIHLAAVRAIHAELAGIAQVVDLMLSHQAVLILPSTDVAYHAMSRELLSGLSETTIDVVVKAYTHMPLLVNAVEQSGEWARKTASQTTAPNRLDPGRAKQIREITDDIRTAARALADVLQGPAKR